MSSDFSSIVVLTGAGISAESGLKTFRDHDGLWENHRVEDVCTPEAFARNPKLVQDFYNSRRRQLLADAKPNAGHRALADFERRFDGQFTLITQNVDNLHEQAGSRDVVHMHGELLKARCTHTQEVVEWRPDIEASSTCPCCGQAGRLRPHIVWFGEVPLYMERIEQALSQCDLFVAIGTSGEVYPAAGFVSLAEAYDAHTVELNLAPSAGRNRFVEHHYGPASVIVADYFEQLI